MRLDLTQASYESIYGTKAVEPSQAKDFFEESFKREGCPMPFWWWTSYCFFQFWNWDWPVDFALPLDKEPPVSPKDLCVLSFNSTQACRWATCVFGRYKGEVTVGEIARRLTRSSSCLTLKLSFPMKTRKKYVNHCYLCCFVNLIWWISHLGRQVAKATCISATGGYEPPDLGEVMAGNSNWFWFPPHWLMEPKTAWRLSVWGQLEPRSSRNRNRKNSKQAHKQE